MASSCHHPQFAVFVVFTGITVNSPRTPGALIQATLASLIQRVTGLYDPGEPSHGFKCRITCQSRADHRWGTPANVSALSLSQKAQPLAFR